MAATGKSTTYRLRTGGVECDEDGLRVGGVAFDSRVDPPGQLLNTFGSETPRLTFPAYRRWLER